MKNDPAEQVVRKLIERLQRPRRAHPVYVVMGWLLIVALALVTYGALGVASVQILRWLVR